MNYLGIALYIINILLCFSFLIYVAYMLSKKEKEDKQFHDELLK